MMAITLTTITTTIMMAITMTIIIMMAITMITITMIITMIITMTITITMATMEKGFHLEEHLSSIESLSIQVQPLSLIFMMVL